jgi:tetratricopeptide (TPR) repeat protein
VSRAAALAIIRPKVADPERPPVDPALVEQDLGPSTRTSVTWLRQYLAQLHDPPASIAAWKKLVDEEQARLKRNKSETSSEIMLDLEWNLADVYRQTGDQAALAAALDDMMALELERFDETAVGLIEWLVDTKSWPALDTFLTKHQERLQQTKRPLYFAAIARAKQGKSDEAEKLAKQASEVPPQPGDVLTAARELEQHNQFEWAVREYRAAIDKDKKETADSTESILARIFLATLLHDHERHSEAADALEPLVKNVQGEGRVGQLYARMREYYKELPDPDVIAARFHFYRAEQYLDDKDPDLKRAQGELDLAINFDPEDADVLIAMYRFPNPEPKWLDSVKQKSRQLAEKLQQKIDQDPSDATNYNQWAWLVANTEGDFQKAVRYSHRSLELNSNGESGAASYLDTLGRCYYAAGDVENAIKYQRQAIEKVDHMQVMHRQLKEFETALEKKKAGSGEPGAGSKK